MKRVNFSLIRGQYLFLFFGLPALFELLIVIVAIIEGIEADGAAFVALSALVPTAFGSGLLFIIAKKMLIQIRISEREITSFLFKKRICTIKTDEEVFYITFEAKEDPMLPMKRYILISNNPIPKIKKENMTPMRYETKKYVLLRYDNETIPYLNTDNWKCCGCFPSAHR